MAKQVTFRFYFSFWWLFYDQLSNGSIFWLRPYFNSCWSVQECSAVVKLHMEIAVFMCDQQKPTESVYDQGEGNGGD